MEDHDALPEPTQPQVSRPPFWRRILARLIDSIILGLFGFILGWFLFDIFAQLGNWGRLLGFGVSLLYFGFLDSEFLGGQTLGKRIVRIKVVNKVGDPLPVGRACLREAIFLAPFFLNQAPVLIAWSFAPGLGTVVNVFAGIVIFGGSLSIVYLFLFNRKTRQSLHDVITGSFVVNAASTAETSVSVWKGHYVVVSVLFAVIAVVGFVSNFVGVQLMRDQFQLVVAIPEAMKDVSGVNVLRQVFVGTRVDRNGTTNFIRVVVTTSDKRQDHQELATKIAKRLLELENAERAQILEISVSYGYDIGIASGWVTRRFVASPAQWRNK